MLESKLLVVNRLGLHARAAAQLVRAAAKFSSSITLFRADRNVFANGKSILSVLALAAAKAELVVSVFMALFLIQEGNIQTAFPIFQIQFPQPYFFYNKCINTIF